MARPIPDRILERRRALLIESPKKQVLWQLDKLTAQRDLGEKRNIRRVVRTHQSSLAQHTHSYQTIDRVIEADVLEHLPEASEWIRIERLKSSGVLISCLWIGNEEFRTWTTEANVRARIEDLYTFLDKRAIAEIIRRCPLEILSAGILDKTRVVLADAKIRRIPEEAYAIVLVRIALRDVE